MAAEAGSASLDHARTTAISARQHRLPRRPHTIPEQIADEIGTAILEGRYKAGDRVGEQEIASLYSVSRGPVREAIRILERRGLVEFFPRRGAFVIDLSLDVIADIFNLQAMFLGLAARYFTLLRPEEGLAAMAAEIEVLRTLNADPGCDPIRFALQNGRIGVTIKRHCGNDHLLRIIRLVAEESLWGFVWHQRPLDYLTPERRLEGIGQWEDVLKAAANGEEHKAERVTQQILFDSRDNVLAVLGKMRNGGVESRRLLSNKSFLDR